MSKSNDNKAQKIRNGFRILSNPQEAAYYKKKQKREHFDSNTSTPLQIYFVGWERSEDDYEEDIINFFEAGQFPHDISVWHAYTLGLNLHLSETGLPQDYIKLNYDRYHFYPAQLLSRYLDDDSASNAASFDVSDHDAHMPMSLSTMVCAVFLWRVIAKHPSVIHIPEYEEILSGPVLDMCYELIDYMSDSLTYDNLSKDAQNIVKAIHICDAHEAANNAENWASKIENGKKSLEDVDKYSELHQKLVVEKTLLAFANPLDKILEGELTRLDKNLNDGRNVLSKNEKKKRFRIVKPQN